MLACCCRGRLLPRELRPRLTPGCFWLSGPSDVPYMAADLPRLGLEIEARMESCAQSAPGAVAGAMAMPACVRAAFDRTRRVLSAPMHWPSNSPLVRSSPPRERTPRHNAQAIACETPSAPARPFKVFLDFCKPCAERPRTMQWLTAPCLSNVMYQAVCAQPHTILSHAVHMRHTPYARSS